MLDEIVGEELVLYCKYYKIVECNVVDWFYVCMLVDEFVKEICF